MATAEVSVLFVCMGNICRSPTAQGVFQHLVKTRGFDSQISVDSAGTHAYHVGESPDHRAQQAALLRGMDLSSQRARKVKQSDFSSFDFIIAMDQSNYLDLAQLAGTQYQEKVYLFLSFADGWGEKEVPDPYYGGGNGFEVVLDMVSDASEGLLDHIVRQYHLD